MKLPGVFLGVRGNGQGVVQVILGHRGQGGIDRLLPAHFLYSDDRHISLIDRSINGEKPKG